MGHQEKSLTKLPHTLRGELEASSNIQSGGVDLQKQKIYHSFRITPVSLDLDEKELQLKAWDVCKILEKRGFECEVDFSQNPHISPVGILVGFHLFANGVSEASNVDLIQQLNYEDAFFKFFRAALNEVGLDFSMWQQGASTLPGSKCPIPYDLYTVYTKEKTSSKETDKAFKKYTTRINELDEYYSKNKSQDRETHGEGEAD